MVEKSLKEIAAFVGGEVIGDENTAIRGASGLAEAVRGEISFLEGAKYLPLLRRSQASAVIVGKDIPYREKPLLLTENPSMAFLKVLGLWHRTVSPRPEGIHPTAVVSERARLGVGVSLGPHAVIEEECEIGDGTAVMANTFVGAGTVIGRDVLIYPNVTIRERTRIDDRVIIHPGAVIGSDGYGYETVEGVHIKIPQLGNVWIQEDVEIGANTTIDRARFGTTTVKKGTKVDNLVQIAHNVIIGEHCLIVSQVGLSGSVEIGDRVVLAGQVGVVEHIKIDSHSVVGAQSGVVRSLPKNSVVIGSPPRPLREEKKRVIYLSRLPQLFQDVRELKKRIK